MRIRSAKDIGAIARLKRVEARRTQDDVARSAGVTRQWLSRFEQGNGEVSIAKVLAVLETLDMVLTTGALHGGNRVSKAPMFSTEAMRSMQESVARGAAFIESESFKNSMRQSVEQLNRLNSQNSEQVRRMIAELTSSAHTIPRLSIEARKEGDDAERS